MALDLALVRAVEGNDFLRVRRLLAQGADPTAFRFQAARVAGWRDRLDILEELFRNGAAVGLRHASVFLGWAVTNRRTGLVQLMLRFGADPNSRQALVAAVRRRYPEALQILLEAGADAGVDDSALVALALMPEFRDPEILQLLFRANAHVANPRVLEPVVQSRDYLTLDLLADNNTQGLAHILNLAIELECPDIVEWCVAQGVAATDDACGRAIALENLPILQRLVTPQNEAFCLRLCKSLHFADGVQWLCERRHRLRSKRPTIRDEAKFLSLVRKGQLQRHHSFVISRRTANMALGIAASTNQARLVAHLLRVGADPTFGEYVAVRKAIMASAAAAVEALATKLSREAKTKLHQFAVEQRRLDVAQCLAGD